MSSFIDDFPPMEIFIARYNFVYWDFAADANRITPIANLAYPLIRLSNRR